ncbi:MAG: CPBP family intramembrane metalloprotease [Opitutaceae bacterium]|nr:CPBP family intramembrane metalloprotease [Opitutaceae bacterium]
MPAEPAQQALAIFELCLLAAGVLLFAWIVLHPAARRRWFGTNALRTWEVSGPEFALLGVLVFLCGFLGQAAAQTLLGAWISRQPDRDGLQLFAYGAAFHGGALLGWRLFPVCRRRWLADYGAPLPADPPAAALPAGRVARYAAGSLVVALPLLGLISLGWTSLLREAGLPDEPQDLIGIFANTRSAAVIAGMFVVACVIAPLNEELIFRAGLYRFCRQRLGRAASLLVSGTLFGALHANWAGFLPLAALGMGLALVYEATGSIRVPVLVHALFNLNTVLVVLSGLPQALPP